MTREAENRHSTDMAAPPPQGFALSPATAVGGQLDFNSKAGDQIYSSATAKLSKELFDCKPEGLHTFLGNVLERATEFGWSDPIAGGILDIPMDLNQAPPVTRNLILSYGLIPIEKIRAWEETYLTTQCRAAQDSVMLHRCLMNLLSCKGKIKVRIKSSEYTIQGILSSVLLLKVIISASHINTNATTATIKDKLGSLDLYLPTIASDISKFNVHVQLLVDGLQARGETTTDLLNHLFKGYMAASDEEFVTYIKRKKRAVQQGQGHHSQAPYGHCPEQIQAQN